MGTSRRYALVVDATIDNRIAQEVMRSGEPLSLSSMELELDVQPLTRTPRPHQVRAWVRYPAAPICVDAIAVAWTPRAVALKWQTGDGSEHKAWVWASAVTARQPMRGSGEQSR
ncbi:MAG: hypothetical protein ACOH1J_08130 [Microbacteriaceae bacterium]